MEKDSRQKRPMKAKPKKSYSQPKTRKQKARIQASKPALRKQNQRSPKNSFAQKSRQNYAPIPSYRNNAFEPQPVDEKKRLHKIRQDDTLVYALGGLGEVGKNMYCIEHDDEILMIDCGVLFPNEQMPGIDYVIPDYYHLSRNNKKRKNLIITHGHEDHIGGIPYLLKHVKLDAIYAPRFAKALILKKLSEHKNLPRVPIYEIDENEEITTKNFKVEFFKTIHSIPDSLGVYVHTPNGNLVHTGDFKFDLSPVGQNFDYTKLAMIGAQRPELLLSDSTNAGVTEPSISEKDVAAEINSIMEHAKGRLIVSTFASNVYRVAQIVEAARRNHRKVAVFGRSMETVLDIGRQMGVISISNSDIIRPQDLKRYNDREVCIICTGSQGEPMAALFRIAEGVHKHIHLKPSDTVVFSSSPIPGNQLSINDVVNKLYRTGATVLDKTMLNKLHTTGHASQTEQKLMIQLVQPKNIMPIHGEYKMLMQHRNTAMDLGYKKDNIFVCANGDILIMRKGRVLQSNWRFQGDDIYVDGNDDSGQSTALIGDRIILGENGLVSVIIMIDSSKNILIGKPKIVSRGFVYVKDSSKLLTQAQDVVEKALLERLKAGKVGFSDLKNTIRSSLEPFLYQKTRRNPMVIPVILNAAKAEAYQQRRKQAG